MDPAADDPDRAGVLPRELLGSHRRHGPGAKRGHRLHVDERGHGPGVGIGHADHTVHHGEPAGGVLRERRGPLEDREPGATGGHGPEVAVRRRVQVDLRRHDPLAAGVPNEPVPDQLHRLGRRDRLEDGVVFEQRELGHPADDTLRSV